MAILRFDSLGYVQRLEDAGMPRQQAVVQAETFQETFGYYEEANRQELATKADVRETELCLQKEIEQVRSELTTKLEEVRADLRATELRLQREIVQVRSELTTKLEEVRADLRATELRLQREIVQVRADLSARIEEVHAGLKAEIEKVRSELQATELRMQKDMARTKYTLLVWQISVSLALAGIMAKGFGWLGF